MTDYLAIALVLIAIGVVLLLAEILLPTGGFLVVGALLFFALGVGTILYYGDTTEAVVALGGLAVGLPAAGFVAIHAWRRLSIGSALDAGPTEGGLAGGSQLTELGALKGRVGKTVSPMRPSGTVEFDGRRLDAMTEGMMIDAGVWVRCVDVKAGNVIVRKMDAPGDIHDINLDDPDPDRDPYADIDLRGGDR
jgi:membrane-bound serine protease (ClpP class)